MSFAFQEVLKSLDDEAATPVNSTDESEKSTKKSDIFRKRSDDNAEAEKSVKQVAKLAANLVKTANKLKSHHNKTKNSTKPATQQTANGAQTNMAGQTTMGQVTQLRSLKKPKPGPKKTGLSATGPGRAGVGNTP